MRCALVLTALAANFAIGSCQFQFLARTEHVDALNRRQGQGDGAQSSSFFSQTSWSFGQDGEFHKQTKTSSTEAGEDGSVMKKRTVCKDGHCMEVVEVLEPPPLPPLRWPSLEEVQWSPEDGGVLTLQAPPQMPDREMQPPPALRGMFNRLMEHMQHQRQQQQQQQQQQPPLIIEMEPMRNMQPPSQLRAILDRLYTHEQITQAHDQVDRLYRHNIAPQEPQEIIIDTRGKGPEMEMILERVPQSISSPRWIEGPRGTMIEIDIPRPPPTYQAPVHRFSNQDMTFVKAGVGIIALGAAYAVVMSALNCYRVDQVSARERPLREFAEPLAPDSVNMAFPGAAARKANPVGMYLSNLYTRANAKNEARGVTTYLARLYARVSA